MTTKSLQISKSHGLSFRASRMLHKEYGDRGFLVSPFVFWKCAANYSTLASCCNAAGVSHHFDTVNEPPLRPFIYQLIPYQFTVLAVMIHPCGVIPASSCITMSRCSPAKPGLITGLPYLRGVACF